MIKQVTLLHILVAKLWENFEINKFGEGGCKS